MTDVAIIGVGLHPFGRFGDKTAFQMGADAVDLALTDAGVAWTDVQFAYGGSWEVAQTDPLTGLLGLTGIPFMNVFNACATAASAIQQTANAIQAGIGDIGVAVGLDKHPAGLVQGRPHPGEHAHVVRRERPVRHHQVLRHEDQPLHERPRDLPRDPGPGGGQELPQRRAQPERLPAQGHERGRDPRLADAQLPADRVDVLRPRRGRRRPGDVPGRHRPPLHRHAGVREGRRRSAPATTAPTRSTPAGRPSTRTCRPRCTPRKAAYEEAGIGPDDVDVAQLQDTDAGAEVIHMAENGFCADGEQEKLIADGATEITGPMPINTDGGLIANGEPIGASGLRQVHELVRQLRGEAGDRQVGGRAEGRLRPGLRRSRHRGGHHPVALISPSVAHVVRHDLTT